MHWYTHIYRHSYAYYDFTILYYYNYFCLIWVFKRPTYILYSSLRILYINLNFLTQWYAHSLAFAGIGAKRPQNPPRGINGSHSCVVSFPPVGDRRRSLSNLVEKPRNVTLGPLSSQFSQLSVQYWMRPTAERISVRRVTLQTKTFHRNFPIN